jgi:hypothetical protein
MSLQDDVEALWRTENQIPKFNYWISGLAFRPKNGLYLPVGGYMLL